MLFRGARSHIPTPRAHATGRRPFLTSWIQAWKHSIVPAVYPPVHNTTHNTIIMPYVSHEQEFYSYTGLRTPLLVHFTHASVPANRFTSLLFGVLSDKQRYPADANPVTLVSVWADLQAGRLLMSKYAVARVPSVFLLRAQMVDSAHYCPAPDAARDDEERSLCAWLRSIDV